MNKELRSVIQKVGYKRFFSARYAARHVVPTQVPSHYYRTIRHVSERISVSQADDSLLPIHVRKSELIFEYPAERLHQGSILGEH